MPGFFVTGTGTGVGKTFVTVGLLGAARRAGRAADAFKPVLSGYDAAAAAESDAGVLLAALGRPLSAAAVERMSPWRFAAPLSPDMAAAAEGRRIDVAAVIAACRGVLPAAEELTLIEGVGGVMVPLAAPFTVLDLIEALALPALLVTGSELGAISHGLTAMAALGSRGIVPAAVILNESAGSSVPFAATERTLRAFCPGVRLASLPRDPQARAFDTLLAELLRGASGPLRPTRTAA